MQHKINLRVLLLFGLLVAAGCEPGSVPLSKSRHTATGTYDADISDDGKYSLVASVNNDAGYWDLENDALLFTWHHSGDIDNGIKLVDISADGSRAVTATEKDIALWDTSNGHNIDFYALPDSDLRDIAISNQGNYLVMGLGDGRVIHLDLKTGRRLEFLAHGEAINSLDISPNGRYVLSGGNDHKAIFWDSRSGQPLQQWQHSSRVILVALSRDGSKAFTSGNKANARVWDLVTGNEISQLDLKKRQYVLSSARFSRDNQQLLTGAPGRQLVLWNADSGKLDKKFIVGTRDKNRPSGAIIYAVAFTENGDLVSESSAGFGEKWSATNLTE